MKTRYWIGTGLASLWALVFAASSIKSGRPVAAIGSFLGFGALAVGTALYGRRKALQEAAAKPAAKPKRGARA